jgi:hypothetical protein
VIAELNSSSGSFRATYSASFVPLRSGGKAPTEKAVEEFDSAIRRMEQLICQNIKGEMLHSAELRNASSTFEMDFVAHRGKSISG